MSDIQNSDAAVDPREALRSLEIIELIHTAVGSYGSNAE